MNKEALQSPWEAVNPYRYASNNPINAVDLDGNHPLLIRVANHPLTKRMIKPVEKLAKRAWKPVKRVGKQVYQQHIKPNATKLYENHIKPNANKAYEYAKGGVNKILDKFSKTNHFSLHPRVSKQLSDPRLGKLASKLNQTKLNKLLNNPAAQRMLDTKSGHINVVQKVEDVMLRITVPNNANKIISVGPIRSNQVANGLKSGRFKPLK